MMRCHLSFSRRILFFKSTALIQELKIPFRTLGNQGHVPVLGTHHGILRGKASHFNSVEDEQPKHVESSSLNVG